MTDERLELSSELVVQAARLIRAIRRAGGDEGARARVLSVLDETGPATVGELARRDRCSQPTMSGAVAALVERGWVTKTDHPTDARASLVTMTDEGAAALAGARRVHGELVARRLERTGHDTEDLAVAVAVLRDLLSPTQEGTA